MADAAALERLWHQAFGDESEEIRAFLLRFLQYDTALVVRHDRSIVSMLFLIETQLVLCDGSSRTVGYIYAGATDRNYRSAGLYKRLLQAAEQEARSRGMAALFLQPADERLAQTYCRLGFTVLLYAHASKGTLISEVPTKTVVSPAVYRAMRNQALDDASVPYIDWPARVYDHCFAWCRGGEDDDGGIVLTADGTVMERIDRSPVLCDRVVGAMKPLDDMITAPSTRMYMGYAMD
ncbi:MAG: GNAT family N-acetyltransferase [Clostridia bacterium]|nr:GNAT family N-acetyltransferase [Clostridia bacterium]